MLERFPVTGTEMLEIFGAEMQVEDPDRGWFSQDVFAEVCNRYNQYVVEGVDPRHVQTALALALLDYSPRISQEMMYNEEVKKERAYAQKSPGYWKE